MPPKYVETVEALFRSPKLWAAAVPLATALVLYQMGELSQGALADAMVVATGIAVGSIAIEEGVSRLLGVLARRQGETVEQPK